MASATVPVAMSRAVAKHDGQFDGASRRFDHGFRKLCHGARIVALAGDHDLAPRRSAESDENDPGENDIHGDLLSDGGEGKPELCRCSAPRSGILQRPVQLETRTSFEVDEAESLSAESTCHKLKDRRFSVNGGLTVLEISR